MFERFTERARRVVVLAQEEARLLNHDYIGTEHLLLGLIHEGEGVAARALESLDVSLDRVRADVEGIIGRGSSAPGGSIAFTPRSKKVLELSLREARELGHDYIGTEHILLGMVREAEGVGAQVLHHMDVSLDRVRTRVAELVGGSPGEEAAGGEGPRERGTLIAAVRAAVRQELGRPGRKGGDPERGPLCPSCQSPLAETAAYRTLEVPPQEEPGPARVMAIAFCRRCGTSLGPLA